MGVKRCEWIGPWRLFDGAWVRLYRHHGVGRLKYGPRIRPRAATPRTISNLELMIASDVSSAVAGFKAVGEAAERNLPRKRKPWWRR